MQHQNKKYQYSFYKTKMGSHAQRRAVLRSSAAININVLEEINKPVWLIMTILVPQVCYFISTNAI